MKSSIKNIAAAFMMLAATGLSANNGNSEKEVKVSTENSKAVVLQMNNLSAGTAISIVDKNGQTLFQDKAKNARYAKVFNLQQMQKGEVYLEIESEEKLEIMTIQVSDSEAHLEKGNQETIEKPILKMNGDQAKVFYGNNGGKTKMTLMDVNGDIAFRQSAQAGSASTYDLSDLPAGNYTFQFNTGDRTFYQAVSIK